MSADVVRAPDGPRDLTFLAPLVGFGLFLVIVALLRAYRSRQRFRLAAAANDRVVRAFNTPMKTRLVWRS